MASIICGSMAFDTIMNFEGRFAEQILPEQLHILNVSFLVPVLRRDFGGCAGNIAYALRQLGGVPLPVAAMGRDGDVYLERLRALDIDISRLRLFEDAFTAQAMIITDGDNNQISGFHPGAMERAHLVSVQMDPKVKLAIIAPDGQQATLDHARELHQAGVPLIFDPGQQLPRFDRSELEFLVQTASWITVNDYEAKMLCDRLSTDPASLSRRVRGLIVTLGAQGCEVWEQGQRRHVQAEKPVSVSDPTGCGDAFRGALLYGLERGWSLAKCAVLGNRVGAIKIAHHGPQSYQLGAEVLQALD